MKMTRRKILLTLAVTFAALLAWLTSETKFKFKGHFHGFFLLSGRLNHRWVLKDDLFLGDGHRLIFALSFDPIRQLMRPLVVTAANKPRLASEWDHEDGNGWVDNIDTDGTILRTFFSRFDDDSGEETHGLFVGGGKAEDVQHDRNEALSNTGMTWFNGQRWLHIWCNVNEGIFSANPKTNYLTPSSWRYLDSEVLISNHERLVLRSRHEVVIDNVPLRIERFAYFRAGKSYFKLGINITNIGTQPVRYGYIYGDEPWLGEYGSSQRNLGWVKGKILPFETTVNPAKENFVGMVDLNYHVANFIEWFGAHRPSLAYISNQRGRVCPLENAEPLVSNERFIGLQWNPQLLLPGKSNQIYLAIGMVPIDSTSRIPVKPDIPLSDFLNAQNRLASP